MSAEVSPRRTAAVLGVAIDLLDERTACERALAWARVRRSCYVVFANAHVVVTADRDEAFSAAVSGADMAMPDGAPVAWLLRRTGHVWQQRVSGPDFMWSLLGRCASAGVGVYLYGSTPSTLSALQRRLLGAFSALRIVGVEAPPFRTPTAAEDAEAVERMNQSGAGVIFVGLGCPKQELWMAAHRGRVHALMLGVGAAFDFHAGITTRAPRIMQTLGVEWLHRLLREPRRLWKRYLVSNTLFVLGAVRQLIGPRNR